MGIREQGRIIWNPFAGTQLSALAVPLSLKPCAQLRCRVEDYREAGVLVVGGQAYLNRVRLARTAKQAVEVREGGRLVASRLDIFDCRQVRLCTLAIISSPLHALETYHALSTATSCIPQPLLCMSSPVVKFLGVTQSYQLRLSTSAAPVHPD